MINKVDEMLKDLIDLAYNETIKVKQKGYFNKEFAEAVGIVISLAYGRWR